MPWRVIAAVIAPHRAQLSGCAAGVASLKLGFVVSPDGTVLSRVTVDGLSAEAVQCVSEVLRGLRFPRPEGGVPVTVEHEVDLLGRDA